MVSLSDRSLLISIRYGIFHKIWDTVSYLLVMLLGPKFAANLSYKTIDWGSIKTGSPTVLCLYRESFIKDIEELRKRGHNNYPVIMGGFTRFQSFWYPKGMQVQTHYQRLIHKNKKSLDISYQYAYQLLKMVQKRLKIDVMLSANFDYWQDHSFKMVCRDLNIPFLVLSREHPVIPSACKDIEKWYNDTGYKRYDAGMAVAGKSSKDTFLQVKGLFHDNEIIVTGLPRYDAWKNIKINTPIQNRIYITLLTFTEGYFADTTFGEVLMNFIEKAEKYDGNIKFVVKTKDAYDTNLVKKRLKKKELNNIILSDTLSLYELLSQSRLVLGYNSLSMVEAVIGMAPIVIPAWGECKPNSEDAMYNDQNETVQKIIQFAYSPDQLNSILDYYTNDSIEGSNYTAEDAKMFISDYIYYSDKMSLSEKFEMFLAERIKSYQ